MKYNQLVRVAIEEIQFQSKKQSYGETKELFNKLWLIGFQSLEQFNKETSYCERKIASQTAALFCLRHFQ